MNIDIIMGIVILHIMNKSISSSHAHVRMNLPIYAMP